ncbi:MAG: hypothetical protein OFPII_40200 [Osedax symbiont Rs1]|nr:MAG: hypothetical protein OFPII_40200 [Osedax symbiont Rs1]
MKYLASCCLAILLSGCDTVYQPLGWDGGYEEKKIAEQHYWLQYLGNSTTSREWVIASWHQRAAQLCDNRYTVLTINSIAAAEKLDSIEKIVSTPMNRKNPTLSGEIRCD